MTKGPYHHGDLPRAVKAAALDEIAEKGASGMRIRAVARRVGVSHAAVFRHYTDRDALLASLARDGFEALAAALNAVHTKGVAPATAIDQGVGIYIGFAQAHPARYRLMFDASVDKLDHPELAAAAAAAFGILVQTFEDIGDSRPHRTATMAWATLHGLVTLSLDGLLSGAGTDLVELACEALHQIGRLTPTSDR